jgi:hypothetical protein
MDIIAKYDEEIARDAHVDELNVKDVAMRLPAIKHKWVSRLIAHKRSLYQLEQQKEQLVEAALKRMKEKTDIQLSNNAMKTKIDSSPQMKQINDDIADQKSIIDYLEHVESIFRYMTNDIKNVTEIMKLELT